LIVKYFPVKSVIENAREKSTATKARGASSYFHADVGRTVHAEDPM
jgi:hypothetical protein